MFGPEVARIVAEVHWESTSDTMTIASMNSMQVYRLHSLEVALFSAVMEEMRNSFLEKSFLNTHKYHCWKIKRGMLKSQALQHFTKVKGLR